MKPALFDQRHEYFRSLWTGWRRRSLFRDVQAYCMFIGHPRSGHTLTGTLLNAHPDAVVAHELDALDYVRRGFGRAQIFSRLLDRDQWFLANGNLWGDFDYNVPNQWQGRFRRLKVIGDKRGGKSSRHLTGRPDLLEKLRATVRLPLRVLHITRNPFDNIATITRHNRWPLEQSAAEYFELARTNLRVLETHRPAEEILTLRHEDFIANPRQHLKRLVEFIGLEADEQYLKDCAGLVFESPNKSRSKAQWNDALIASIHADIEKIPFLRGYRFDS